MHKRCKDPACPICNRSTTVDSKEEIKTIDVSDGKLQVLKLERQTDIVLKGKHVPEQKFTLIAGTYAVNEVIKNIYTTEHGKYVKIGVKHFLVADRTA